MTDRWLDEARDPFAPPADQRPPEKGRRGSKRQDPNSPGGEDEPADNPYGQVKPAPVRPWTGGYSPRAPERPTGPRPPYDRRPEPEKQLERYPRDLTVRWALTLSIGGTVCTMLSLLYFSGLNGFPSWMFGAGAGLAMSSTAIYLGSKVQRKASNAGKRSPEAVASVTSGVISGILALIVLLVSLALFGKLREYSHCMRDAITQSQQDTCQNIIFPSSTP